MLRFENICKSYDAARSFVVNNVSLHLQPGEFLAIIGASGCGKTTTLKMANRLIEPTSGRIWFDGKDIAHENVVDLRRRIGYVIQQIGLFPHLNVAQNVGTVPSILGWPLARVRARVAELLALVGLEPNVYRDRLPADLSGGQKQRVGLARALAGRPQLVLMDEPFGAIDPIARDQLQQTYLELARELNLTTVMVTHDVSEALIMADRLAVMRDGQLIQVGTPAGLSHSTQDDYVQQLLSTPRRQMRALAHALKDHQA